MARVRFAPSPTGSLHLGGLRTALFNYLLAKKTGGQLILRIEDTDRVRLPLRQKRNVPNVTRSLIATFDRLGIVFDEGPHVYGPCGPYVQSHRLELYRSHALQLVECGMAYPCFCSKQRLQSLGRAGYDGLCRHLPRPQAVERVRQGQPHTIRLQVGTGHTVVEDTVYGSVTFNNATIKDQVLLKSDGFPTYHLASVVDDHLMGISHVLRGEEWLPSTPKHMLLYRALGWQPPVFVHLPLLLNREGQGKLSKRDGSASVEALLVGSQHELRVLCLLQSMPTKDAGHLPSSLLNFVALLGWAPQGTQEIFSLQELVQGFSLDRINRAGVKVDMDKLQWISAQHFVTEWRTQTGHSALLRTFKEEVEKCYGASRVGADAAVDLFSWNYVERVAGLMLEQRSTIVPDMVQDSVYFFVDPTPPQGAVPIDVVHSALASFSQLEGGGWGETAIGCVIEDVACKCDTSKGKVLAVLRAVLTGNKPGPSVAGVAAVLGQERTLQRLRSVLS